jgi:hypothetical protein
VISGFGIALSSTIVGVIVRVVLLQYRVDLVAREKETRLQLNDAMRRFHVEIEDVVRGTKYLGAEIRQSVDEHHQQMAESYEQRTEKLVEELSTGFKQILDGILEHGKDTNRRLASSTRGATSSAEKAVVEALNSVSEQMQETNVAINESTRAAADALKHSLQETGEMISESMGVVRTEAQRSVEETSSAHSETIRRQAALMEEAASSMQHAIGSYAGKLEESLSGVEAKMAKLLDVSGQSLEQTVEAMKRLTENLERTSLEVSENISEKRAELKKQAEELENLVDNPEAGVAILGPAQKPTEPPRQSPGSLLVAPEATQSPSKATTEPLGAAPREYREGQGQEGPERPRGLFGIFGGKS